MTNGTGAPVITIAGGAFGYEGRRVVTDVDLEVRPGEVVALLGPNGSGKTTLVKGLLGLNDHLDGTVELFGVDLGHFTQRTRLGYVPQRHSLSASVRATAREVVEVGRLPLRRWWQRRSRHDEAVVTHALETVGLADRAAADVATLSGGQQRRVLIARALAAEPDILVMDEPTAGVDAASQDILAMVLRRLVARGVTMLIVTHELAALRGIVDRIVRVDRGGIAFDGTPREYGRHEARQASAATNGHHHEDELEEETGGLGLPVGPFDDPSTTRTR